MCNANSKPRAENKKPHSELCGFSINSGRGERIRTSGLYVPNVALYQAKLHPDLLFAVRRDAWAGEPASVATLQQRSRQLYQSLSMRIRRELCRG